MCGAPTDLVSPVIHAAWGQGAVPRLSATQGQVIPEGAVVAIDRKGRVHWAPICAAMTASRIRVAIDRFTPGNVCNEITIVRLNPRRRPVSARWHACCGCLAAWRLAMCRRRRHRRPHQPAARQPPTWWRLRSRQPRTRCLQHRRRLPFRLPRRLLQRQIGRRRHPALRPLPPLAPNRRQWQRPRQPASPR